MIKAAGRTGLGLPLLLLGLPPMEIVIHYGRTEAAILKELEAHGVKLRTP